MIRAYRDQDWLRADVVIRPSPIHGKGMFAIRNLAEGDPVAIWGGAFVDRKAAAQAESAGKVVQQLEEDLFEIVDRSNPGPSYFQNHSCDPNTGMNDEVTVVALCAIRPGEELTLDYATFELNEEWVMPWECRCGAPTCRKTITGRDWKLAHLQERYGPHFSPVLLRRMASR